MQRKMRTRRRRTRRRPPRMRAGPQYEFTRVRRARRVPGRAPCAEPGGLEHTCLKDNNSRLRNRSGALSAYRKPIGGAATALHSEHVDGSTIVFGGVRRRSEAFEAFDDRRSRRRFLRGRAVAVGGTGTGDIEKGHDRDWCAVTPGTDTTDAGASRARAGHARAQDSAKARGSYTRCVRPTANTPPGRTILPVTSSRKLGSKVAVRFQDANRSSSWLKDVNRSPPIPEPSDREPAHAADLVRREANRTSPEVLSAISIRSLSFPDRGQRPAPTSSRYRRTTA